MDYAARGSPLKLYFAPLAPGTLQVSAAVQSIKQERGQVAQLVEQRTENPCVGGSIPSLATIIRTTAGAKLLARFVQDTFQLFEPHGLD